MARATQQNRVSAAEHAQGAKRQASAKKAVAGAVRVAGCGTQGLPGKQRSLSPITLELDPDLDAQLAKEGESRFVRKFRKNEPVWELA